jgi:putative flippase GtrA
VRRDRADADAPHGAPKEPASGATRRLGARFAAVGVANTIFGFGVFAFLEVTIGERVPYLIILLISHVVSVLEAYVLHRYLVFQVRGRWFRDLARFWMVYLGALAFNLVALPGLVEWAGLPVLVAQAIVVLISACGSFFLHRGFSFARREKDTVGP